MGGKHGVGIRKILQKKMGGRGAGGAGANPIMATSCDSLFLTSTRN